MPVNSEKTRNVASDGPSAFGLARTVMLHDPLAARLCALQPFVCSVKSSAPNPSSFATAWPPGFTERVASPVLWIVTVRSTGAPAVTTP